MNTRHFISVFIALLTISCSLFNSIIPGTSSESATPSSLATEPASELSSGPSSFGQPLDVKVILDSTHSSSQTISSDGGTIQATTQDGTLYTLTIPKDALIEDTEISMTPVSEIEGLPLSGGLQAAVQFAPDGLIFLEPATLAITPKTSVPVEELVSFAYLGDGKGLHLFPLSGDPAQTTFQIMHFSGYGTGKGNSGNIQRYTPGSAQTSADSQAAQVFQDIWSNHGGQMTNQHVDQLCEIARQWYDASVITDLKAAETDSSRIFAAGGQYLSWLHNVQLLGCEDGFAAEIKAALASLAKGLQHAYHEAQPKCELEIMYKCARWAGWLSLLAYAPDLESQKFIENIKKCQVFELEIGGSITLQGATPITFTIEKGSVLLKRASETTFEGTNDLQAGFEGIDPDCTFSEQPKMNFQVKAENQDELVHKGTPFEFTVTMTGKWEASGTCGGPVQSFSKSAMALPTFQLPAEDGASYEWKSPGFKEGAISFTIRDKYGYLDWIGRVN